MTPLDPSGRRARILRATRDGATFSEISRRVMPARIAAKKDVSLQRLKTNSALRRLKAEGLLTRTPHGWMPTPAGLAELDRMSAAREGTDHVQG